MRLAILRNAPADAPLPAPGEGLGITVHDRARLAPPSRSMQVQFTSGGVRVQAGSFTGTSWPFTQLAIVDAESRASVVAWLQGASGDGTEFEVRESGCAGGLPGVDPASPATLPRFAVFVRADATTEAEAPPPAGRLDAMARANGDAVRTGLLLAADGLRSTARATRATVHAGRLTLRDGPFAEAKELIAGFWLVQAPAIDAVIDWVRRYPYAQDQACVEIRPVVG